MNTTDILALAERLEAWGPLVSSGYEVPAAGTAMHEAAVMLRVLATADKPDTWEIMDKLGLSKAFETYGRKLKWGITPYQPECWALLDAAVDELVERRALATTDGAEAANCLWIDKPCTCGGGACEQVDFGDGLAAPPAPEVKAEAEMGWQWRSRIFQEGVWGAWDAWETGRFGGNVPSFMEVQERRIGAAPAASSQELSVAEMKERAASVCDKCIGDRSTAAYLATEIRALPTSKDQRS